MPWDNIRKLVDVVKDRPEATEVIEKFKAAARAHGYRYPKPYGAFETIFDGKYVAVHRALRNRWSFYIETKKSKITSEDTDLKSLITYMVGNYYVRPEEMKELIEFAKTIENIDYRPIELLAYLSMFAEISAHLVTEEGKTYAAGMDILLYLSKPEDIMKVYESSRLAKYREYGPDDVEFLVSVPLYNIHFMDHYIPDNPKEFYGHSALYELNDLDKLRHGFEPTLAVKVGNTIYEYRQLGAVFLKNAFKAGWKVKKVYVAPGSPLVLEFDNGIWAVIWHAF